MSKKTTVTLDSPIEGHEGSIRQVVFREPRYRDIMGHGKPYSVHLGPDGRPLIINDEDALSHYVEACCVEPKETSLLMQLCLSDTMKVRETILDFFLQPAKAGSGSTASPVTYGSAPESPPTP